MDRIIGIDFGSARTGLAVSDPLQIFASALDTLPSAKIIDYLKKYEDKGESIVRFVVGYPLNLSGALPRPHLEWTVSSRLFRRPSRKYPLLLRMRDLRPFSRTAP